MRQLLFLVLAACIALPATAPAAEVDTARLETVLEAQDADLRMRSLFRHPAETLSFFGVAPGSVVVEALPGGGWYSRILAAYLGPKGTLVGVDYSMDMFPLFGFFSAEQLAERENWKENWVAGAAEWGVEDGARVEAFVFGGLPEELKGTADTVLFIRALHNLARFEDQGGFLTQALRDAFDVLKPGGTVGVVQHEARPDMPDDWANGDNGYLKWDFVVGVMEAAGFEFVAASDVNENPLDQPTVDDTVWRLPPVMNTSRDDPALRAQVMSIGESNRMTLKFRKPEQE